MNTDLPEWIAQAANQAEILRGLAIAAVQNPGLDLRESLLVHARRFIDVVLDKSPEGAAGGNVVKFARKSQ